jgi:hypothetical protein
MPIFSITRKLSTNSGLSMAGVVPLDALGQQTFPTALPASSKGGAAAFAFHPRAESVLSFPCPFGWLISAFHKTED